MQDYFCERALQTSSEFACTYPKTNTMLPSARASHCDGTRFVVCPGGSHSPRGSGASKSALESAADSRTGYEGLHRPSALSLSRPSRCCRPLSALLVLRCGERLVTDGLRHSDFAVWELSVILDVVDDPVGGRNQVGDFLGLVWRQIEHLHASAGDFHSMVVPEAVPRLAINRRPCKLLGNNEFDLSHGGICVSRVVNLAHYVRIGCDDFAIVMVGAHNVAVH